MKALLVLALVLLLAATALAYGHPEVAGGLNAVVETTSEMSVPEPVAMLLSGGLLLVAAGAVRRLSL